MALGNKMLASTVHAGQENLVDVEASLSMHGRSPEECTLGLEAQLFNLCL